MKPTPQSIALHLSETKPLRTCMTLHECLVCKQSITLGQAYYDGGYGRRVHVDCVPMERERKEA